MVVFLDIDKFLTRNDLRLLKTAKWPWRVSHFILAKKCHYCDSNTNTNIGLPTHFILFNDEQIYRLLYYTFFWCQTCLLYTIYDHYPEDECQYCE